MRIGPASAQLEALAKIIRHASDALLNAEMFDRWGPTNDVEQREAIEREAAGASKRRAAAIEELERRIAELREQDVGAVQAWARAHVELLDDYLGRVAADGTEAYVAKQEREQWLELCEGQRERVQQNVFYVRYDRALYQQIFGVDP